MEVHEKPAGVKIFLDLDGTLIDSKERLYRLFQHLVPTSTFSYAEYWEYKSNKIGHSEILKNIFSFSDEAITQFQKKWMDEIEKPQWLALDKPFEGVTSHLVELKKQHELYLVTARQFENMVLLQLHNFGWASLFTGIFVTAQKKEKMDLIKEAVAVAATDWFVGDTGKDIQTGKSLGLKTAAVLSGFLNKEKLLEYEPDMIVENVINLDFK